MTQEQKTQLFDLLMSKVSQQEKENSFGYELYKSSTLEDIAKIEPLIDIFICDARIEEVKKHQASIERILAKKGNANGSIPNNQAST
jgi:hypothetical protein